MDRGTRNFLTLTELLAYVVLVVIVGVGFALAVINESYFQAYVREDSFFETATAIILVICAGILLTRYVRERGQHTWTFAAFSLGMSLLLIVGAGEEISWGQRIFNVQSNEFFLANNRQGETNLHNMVINGVNVNKALARTSALFILVFYLALPYIYSRGGQIHGWMNALSIPMPKIHHGAVLFILAIVIDQIPSGKRGELNEVMIALFILLLFTFGQNIRHERRW